MGMIVGPVSYFSVKIKESTWSSYHSAWYIVLDHSVLAAIRVCVCVCVCVCVLWGEGISWLSFFKL